VKRTNECRPRFQLYRCSAAAPLPGPWPSRLCSVRWRRRAGFGWSWYSGR